MNRYVDQEGLENLCNAIVIQAARDLRKAYAKLKKNPKDRDALYLQWDCESFFRSQYYEMLTDVDGSYLIRKLREEAGWNER